MGLGDKYDMSNCGCNGGHHRNTRNYGGNGCCNDQVQQSPEPCCESHETIYKAGICLYTTADIVTTNTTFYMTFSNLCTQTIAINTAEVFFYHATAGLLRIISLVNGTYEVELVDITRAGTEIKTTDCILVQVLQNVGGVIPSSSQCLSGNFVAPALNADSTIYIYNGAGIAIGSTITFTASGETGSYLVKGFISATGNVYAYTVTNVGAGHTPGTIINGGCDGVCTIPIIVVSTIDVCDLSESQTVDSMVGCKNGSPRAFKPSGVGDVPYGTADETWELRKLTNLDCCVLTDGCLKFSVDDFPVGSDQVVLQDVNLDCFIEALNFAQAHDNNLAMNINGMNVVVTAYDAGAKTITIEYAGNEPITELMEFPAGTQICLGSCCDSCVATAQHSTNVQYAPTDQTYGSLSDINLVGQIVYPTGTSYWLIGKDYATGNATFLELDDAYFADPDPGFIGKPTIEDPMVFRQKICNDSDKGCDQECMIYLNFWLGLWDMSDKTNVNFQVRHFAAESKTLCNNTTPNPFSEISTQEETAGTIYGPVNVDAKLVNTSFGPGNSSNNKPFPYESRSFKDVIILRKNNSAMSMVWCFLRINTTEELGGTFNTTFTCRRHITKNDRYGIPYPANALNIEGFKGL